jgi:hypothetical protein
MDYVCILKKNNTMHTLYNVYEVDWNLVCILKINNTLFSGNFNNLLLYVIKIKNCPRRDLFLAGKISCMYRHTGADAHTHAC